MATTTSQAERSAPASGRPVRDLRPLWRILVAVLLPLGPLCITLIRAVMPSGPTTTPARSSRSPSPSRTGSS